VLGQRDDQPLSSASPRQKQAIVGRINRLLSGLDNGRKILGQEPMSKSISTWLLAAGVFALVAAGAFMITTMALSNDDPSEAALGSDTVSEQRVLFFNLGMG
jgi:hypothetical protein